MINTTFSVIKAIKSKGCCIFFLAATSNSLCLGFLKHDLTLKTETTSSRVSIRQVLSSLRRLQRNFRLFAFVMWAVDYLLHQENMRWVNNFFLILLFLLLIGRTIMSEIKKSSTWYKGLTKIIEPVSEGLSKYFCFRSLQYLLSELVCV